MSAALTCCEREWSPMSALYLSPERCQWTSAHERFTMKNTILPNARACTISPFVLILRAGYDPAFRLLGRRGRHTEALLAFHGR
jgi:hypothetical protein